MPDYADFGDDVTILVNFPQWLKMTDMSLNSTAMKYLWINVHDPDDYDTIDKIYDVFEKEFGIGTQT